MTDSELERLTEKTGIPVEKLKKIREKQILFEKAIDYCRRLEKEHPEIFDRLKPTKPGETRFNVCVSKVLKGEWKAT